MVARKPKGKYTYADYAATPDDERWELIDGELYRMASGASTKHQLVTLELAALLRENVRRRTLGWIFIAPYDVILSDTNTVEPDIVFVSAARRSIITERACEGAPDQTTKLWWWKYCRHQTRGAIWKSSGNSTPALVCPNT